MAKLIVRVIREKEACFGAVRAEVKALTDAHPLYPDLTAASSSRLSGARYLNPE